MIKLLDFCVLKFYDKYVISIINAGVNLTVEKSNIMSQIALDYYENKPFVYITNRIHEYTVEPEVFKEISKMKSLAGFVVVSDSKDSIKNALLEKIFLDKPFQIFNNLEDAVLWARNISVISKNKNSTNNI